MSKSRKTPRRWSAAARRRVAKRRAEWRSSVYGRLEADGASKLEQIRRRAFWVVLEWKLPPFPPIGRTPSGALCDYLKVHNISADWLLWGDLKGLQRMMEWRRAGKPDATATPPSGLKEKLALLSESQREVIGKIVDQLAEQPS